MNITNFSRINSYFGTNAGDKVLDQVGINLNNILKDMPDDFAGYQHGDKYMILLKGDIEDVLYNDYILYTVGEKTFGVRQFFTMNFDEIKSKMNDYIRVLDEVSEANNYSLVALYVTDIIKNGSYVIYNTKGQDIMNQTYDKEMNEGDFIEKCVSRKKNVIPLIMDAFEEKKEGYF